MDAYKREICNWYDWNEFVNACRENVKKRAVFAVSQDGDNVNLFFIVKNNIFDSGDVAFFDSKTGKKSSQYFDDRKGFYEYLAGPVGKITLPFCVIDVNKNTGCYLTRPEFWPLEEE